jgi:hypothetical protein
MAHQYTRGTWTAPETRNIEPKKTASPYCTPAQVVVPLLLRWMLVFEEPWSDEVWLAKGTPRKWLEEGGKISVSGAPTRWGRIGFSISSHLKEGRVEAALDLSAPFGARVKLRLRVPEGNRIRTVTLNGNPWAQFDPEAETVLLPAGSRGKIALTVNYR